MLVTIQLNDADLETDGVQLALAELLIALRGRTTIVDKNGEPVRKAKRRRTR